MATSERVQILNAPHDVSDLPPAAREFDLPRRKFTAEEYLRMAEAGILGRREPVELIDGEIVLMCPIGFRHSGTVLILTNALVLALAGRALVSAQNPLRISEKTEPQPDLAVLRPRFDSYTKSHPGPADVLLVIEVMESSARYDRDVKRLVYAKAGVPEVWLVDVSQQQVEIYRSPAAADYGEIRILGLGDSFSPEAFPDVILRVDTVLGLGGLND